MFSCNKHNDQGCVLSFAKFTQMTILREKCKYKYDLQLRLRGIFNFA